MTFNHKASVAAARPDLAPGRAPRAAGKRGGPSPSAGPLPSSGSAPSGGSAPRAAGERGGPISIGQAAHASGVSAKMVRHYESLGLLGDIARTDSGYRLYRSADVHTLRFIKRARELGFSMAEIAGLVSLWHDHARASASVKKIAQVHLQDLEKRIQAMQAMRRTLQDLLHHCHGDERPDCPILDDLAGTS